MIKPSELAPESARLIAELVPRYLDSDAVAVVEGGAATTTALLAQGFDHAFFTGSPEVGKKIMAGAAPHLTPVTLELGGKSPVIVTSDADIDVAARRIIWAKLVNSGQTCITPDYLLVSRDVLPKVVLALTTTLARFQKDSGTSTPDRQSAAVRSVVESAGRTRRRHRRWRGYRPRASHDRTGHRRLARPRLRAHAGRDLRSAVAGGRRRRAGRRDPIRPRPTQAAGYLPVQQQLEDRRPGHRENQFGSGGQPHRPALHGIGTSVRRGRQLGNGCLSRSLGIRNVLAPQGHRHQTHTSGSDLALSAGHRSQAARSAVVLLTAQSPTRPQNVPDQSERRAMSDFTMTIDSEQVASNEWIPVEDPSTGTVFARAPQCTPEQLDAAMASAARAQITWAADEPARQEALRRCAATLNANNEAIAQVLTAEQGKPIARNLGARLRRPQPWFDYYANLDRRSEIVQDDARAHISVDRRPLGVVAAITPWNFPVMLSSWKVAPALRAGNTVVLKPSPFTPLTALLIGKLLADELPAGALNVVTGGNQLGNLVTTHPIPRKISFTGSTPTGIKVATAAAATLKRVTPGAGRKRCSDRPRRRRSRRYRRETVLVCIYQQRTGMRRDQAALRTAVVVRKIRRRPRGGRGRSNRAPESSLTRPWVRSTIDPSSNASPAWSRTHAHGGARIATGGIALDRPGHFYRPTILADVPDSAPIAAEEQFGPALPVLPYTTVDDAVARANDTRFGLAGSVWGGDQDQARAVADRLEAGIVWVNTHAAPSLRAPLQRRERQRSGR